MNWSLVRRIFSKQATILVSMLIAQSALAQNPGFIWSWGNVVGGSGASLVPFRPSISDIVALSA